MNTANATGNPGSVWEQVFRGNPIKVTSKHRRCRGGDGDRGEERAREREREREGGPPNGLWCPWVSMARLVLPLVPWLESAVHTGAQTQTQTMVQTQAHWVHMHIGRTDTGTYAQSTYACRCSVAMVKLEVVHFIAETVHRGHGNVVWYGMVDACDGYLAAEASVVRKGPFDRGCLL